MKDEIFELLAPELLESYRRWRPRLAAIQIVAVGLAAAGQVIALVDGGKYCVAGSVAAWLIYSGILVWIVHIIIDKRLTRGLSMMGAQMASPLRRYLTAAWMVASMTGLATVDAVYGQPISNQAYNRTCN